MRDHLSAFFSIGDLMKQSKDLNCAFVAGKLEQVHPTWEAHLFHLSDSQFHFDEVLYVILLN